MQSMKINLLRQPSEEEGTQLASPLQLKIRGILITRACILNIHVTCKHPGFNPSILRHTGF